jgi:hygromycin-B 4-O-kinase
MTIKPIIEKTEVLALLTQFYNQPVYELAPLGTGHIALVFSFWVDDQEYVARFVENKMADALKKEIAVANLLKGSDVPLPPILHQGTFADFHFVIAPRAAGLPLDEMTSEQYEQVLPDVIAMLDAVHQVDISGTQGFGVFDETAVGQFSSWPEYLLRVAEEEEVGFYGKWHGLFEETFLERPLFEQLFAEMQRLFTFLPEERYLIHGDYGFNNVLAERGKVTAVLDWANAKYGDFLFDIAYLTASTKVDYEAAFQQYYHVHHRAVPHYSERVRCYQCYTTLDGLRFFAKTGNHDGYQWVKRGIAENLGFE